MSKAPTFQASQFIAAIPGTSGIISSIAKKVGCSWNTAKAFIDNYPTVKAAFEAEREGLLDIAESVLANNIKLSLQQQQSGKVTADSTDAKWVLARLGKHRGYAEKQEIEHSGETTQHIIGLDSILKKAWGSDTATPGVQADEDNSNG